MWAKIKSFFADSETIFWARLQMFIGAAMEILSTIDPTLIAGVMPAEWFPWYLLANGLLTEVLRRRRAEDL